MTKQRTLWGVLALGLAVLACDVAYAQGPDLRPFRRPTTSPYLNLLRRDGLGTGLNYHRLVRPEMEFRRAYEREYQAIRQLDRRLDRQDQRLESLKSEIGTTGHTTSFMSLGGYFGTGGGRGYSTGFGRPSR